MVHNRNSLSPRLVKRTFKPYYILSDLQQLPTKNAAFSTHSSATQISERIVLTGPRQKLILCLPFSS